LSFPGNLAKAVRSSTAFSDHLARSRSLAGRQPRQAQDRLEADLLTPFHCGAWAWSLRSLWTGPSPLIRWICSAMPCWCWARTSLWFWAGASAHPAVAQAFHRRAASIMPARRLW